MAVQRADGRRRRVVVAGQRARRVRDALERSRARRARERSGGPPHHLPVAAARDERLAVIADHHRAHAGEGQVAAGKRRDQRAFFMRLQHAHAVQPFLASVPQQHVAFARARDQDGAAVQSLVLAARRKPRRGHDVRWPQRGRELAHLADAALTVLAVEPDRVLRVRVMQAPQLDVLGAVRHELAPLVARRVVLVVLAVGVPRDAVDVRERVAFAPLADGDQAGKHARLQLRGRALARPRELVEGRVRGRPVEDVHGVVDVVGDGNQPLAVLRKRQADHRGRALKRELRDSTFDLPGLLVHGGVPYAYDGRAGGRAHLPGGHDALPRVHRRALDVVVVPVEKVLLVQVPVKHDAHGGGVVHGVVVLVVEQVVGGVA